ncbi:MAG: hypothetical protein AVDCRST_MAG19-3745, partial [uncultured Thermomicrobiales bacterium]
GAEARASSGRTHQPEGRALLRSLDVGRGDGVRPRPERGTSHRRYLHLV